MITKQAFLNLAAVDDDYAAELEKVAINWGGLGQRFRSFIGGKSGNVTGSASAGASHGVMGPPKPNASQMNMAMRQAQAHQGVRDAVINQLSGWGKSLGQKTENAVNWAGTSLKDAVFGGQFRRGLSAYKQGLGQPMKSAINQGMVNRGVADMAAGAAKTGLLYGGLGYGGYRMLRNDGSDAPVASMYHQAMPY